jgi:biopolymer transport protein ExbB
MNDVRAAWEALRYGGAIVYPLLMLGIIAVLIILDRAVAYYRCLRLPRSLAELVETYGFAWDDLDRQLAALAPVNVYRRFFGVISENRDKPAWWVEHIRLDEEQGERETVASVTPLPPREGRIKR